MQELYFLIANTTVVFTVVFACISIFLFGKSSKVNNQLVIYIIVAGSIEVVSFIFAEFKMNNLRFIHLYTVLDFVLLSVLLRRVIMLLKGKFDIQIIYIPVLILLVLNTVFLQGLDIYNSNASTLSSITIIGFCLYSFALLLNDSAERASYETDNSTSNIKLILTGIFISHATALSVMFLSNMILQISSEQTLIIWMIRAIMILIAKVLFFIALSKTAYHVISISYDGR